MFKWDKPPVERREPITVCLTSLRPFYEPCIRREFWATSFVDYYWPNLNTNYDMGTEIISSGLESQRNLHFKRYCDYDVFVLWIKRQRMLGKANTSFYLCLASLLLVCGLFCLQFTTSVFNVNIKNKMYFLWLDHNFTGLSGLIWCVQMYVDRDMIMFCLG